MPPFHASFLVNRCRGFAIFAKLFICARKKLASPRNCRISFTVDGAGAFSIKSVLLRPGLYPSALTSWPKKFVCSALNLDFSKLTLRWYCLNLWNTVSIFCSMLLWSVDFIIMSSRYTKHIFGQMSRKIRSITAWKDRGTDVRPIGLRKNWNLPCPGILKAVLCRSSGCKGS